MDFALSSQHEEIRRTVREFAERRIAPEADEMERKGEFPMEIIREAASLGPAGRAVPRRDRRHRPRLAGLRDHGRGALARLGQRRDHRQRPHQPGLQPDLACRHRRAEGALPAAHGLGRGDRRLRPHRAGSGKRLARHAHPRASRRRRVGHQRREAVHHQRRRGWHVHRHRRHRPRGGQRQDQRLHRRCR